MRCLAACQTELAIRMLDEILLPSFEVEFLVESKPLARRLHDSGLNVVFGDLKRTDTYLKADLTPGTCVVVEDNGRKSLRKVLEAIWDAGGTLVYVLGVGTRIRASARKSSRRSSPNSTTWPSRNSSAVRFSPSSAAPSPVSRSSSTSGFSATQTGSSSSCTTIRPDALASGLALRNVLRRNRQTAVIAAFEGVTRPENQRMMNLLDIQIEIMTAAHVNDFDRIAMVDVQPHYFGEIDRVDLVIDHHPEQSGYTAVYKDIRVDYGSTSTILTEHLRAVDANISERTATAMLYAIKSDTLSSTGRRIASTSRRSRISIRLPTPRSSARWKARKSRWTGWTTCSRHGRTADDRAGVLRVPRHDTARGLHSLRCRFLPAARGRPVDDHLGHRQRHAGDVGPESGRTRATPASSCGSTSTRSAAPAAIAPWPRRGGATAQLQREVRQPSGRRAYKVLGTGASSSSTSTSARTKAGQRNDEGHARLFQLRERTRWNNAIRADRELVPLRPSAQRSSTPAFAPS